ncbi:SLAM family member 5-like isoform X2 [Talpa occidentalis]|uniref:SLAM family member 5-like isoform X2 n=1 Tax=Talpa occidentalis TaxID=50954 RepID=UPI00188FE712|nr:SLAM family member 5-like isoform X2 [Talpa occidentalis]XP_037362559.1 SLAM family member 5-like isoform X2 [Talpa occidentalis]
MAQPLLWILLLCLQTWPETAGSNTDVCTVNGILGESVTFPLNIPESQQVGSIVWQFKTSIAFVQPGDSGTVPKVIVTHNSYNDRINVSGQNYNLEMRNLGMEDAGIYSADITLKTSSTTETKRYNLQIYRRLGKPKITPSLMTSVNSTCNVTLTCFVEEEDKNVTYSWSSLGREGNIIRIFQSHEDPEHTYTCTAWNPVSNSSESISAQQLCSDTGLNHQRRHIGLLSTVAVLFLFMLIILPVILLLLRKRGQDAESKTIYTEVSRTTRPAESRLYDEILQTNVSLPKEEAVNSVYSTVQPLEKSQTNIYSKQPQQEETIPAASTSKRN